ncbi:MAG: DUF3631 domain-containing protein, partial [Actinomycetota bacterium]|nr:DUF3631 domain-containing protein [Actinomycetota bacterium]
MLDDVRSWLSRFICTLHDSDLDLLALWAAASHLVQETYTSPRLVLDSPVPGSGKTTVLEHFERLCLKAVQMASLSSPALLTRMLHAGMRTVLIDEADRCLHPDKEGVAELLAVLNSGYKRGATRPVLVPSKDGWTVAEMPTYCPVVMAGNNPRLPEDTMTRTIRVLLLPDLDGAVEESNWEALDGDARDLGRQLGDWAEQVREQVKANRPPLPPGITGRARERWSPLKRVAVAAGGRWPAVVDRLALRDKEQQDMDREDGMLRERPAVTLLRQLYEVWPNDEPFTPTSTLLASLIAVHPDDWGPAGPFGKALTAQRLGRMLAQSYAINSTRQASTGPRGYARVRLATAWRRMGITKPAKQTGETGETGSAGSTGATDTTCQTCGRPLWAPQSQA